MNKLDLAELLQHNSYPGRGIVLGRSADGNSTIAVYFIMGRSENSRNRIFTPTNDGICTEAYDPAKMTDPDLIIYHPVRELENSLIVTNGDQTDTIRDALLDDKTFAQALYTREFEPDAPNYTPRISGLMSPDGSFRLSILKSDEGNPHSCLRYFYIYDLPQPGEGRFIHTYMGDSDPLPAFDGEPVCVTLDAPDAAALADQIWNALNPEHKVSLFVRYTNLEDGSHEDVIRNKRCGD